jgi:predicted O-methyltransferase YrrM
MTLATEFERLCRTPSDIVDHLPRFVALVEELDATSVIELGTRTGVSTIAWLYALEGKGHLTSVDLDGKPPIGDYPHWTFIQGDDLSMKVLERLKPADIVFIDTSHLYDHTIVELNTYLDLVKPGGRIVCHDTRLRRPEGSPPRPLFPVRTAILEFVAKHDLEWDEYLDSWGLAVIKIPEAMA